jgi:hypothetical protein
VCTFDGCGKRFKRRKALDAHLVNPVAEANPKKTFYGRYLRIFAISLSAPFSNKNY